jgi:hypothetical protein
MLMVLFLGEPDLRNLSLYYHPASTGDIVILLSDGVHDNLDPQMLGVSPRDLGLPVDNWNDVEREASIKQQADVVKRVFMLKLLKRITHTRSTTRPLTPHDITQSLVRYAISITNNARAFMEANPGKKQPK